MTRRFFALATLVALAAPLSPPPVQAQADVIIYRCVAADGAVTLQNNAPCPKGSQQTIRHVGAVTTVPLPAGKPPAAAKPAAPTAPAAAAPASPPPPPPPLVRSAPPALFQCSTWDERDYLSEVASPPGTCVAVETHGLDGADAPGAGQTCEMRYDTCEAVVADQLCAAWKKRMDEAEFRWKFAGARNDGRKAEFERFAKIYRESTCVRD